MGFFRRRAKAKNGPAVDHHQQQRQHEHDDYDEEDVFVSRRPPSKFSRHQHHHHRQRQRHQSRDDRYHRCRHDGIYDVDDYPEAVIEELPPEPEQSLYDNDGSVGDTLATEDHFDLHVPIKQPKRGILRKHSGPGLILLPSGGSFSKIWNKASNDSDSVSSVSCDSRLFVDPDDDDDDDNNNNPQHPINQENLTISMRSIKSRQSKQSKNNSSRPDPPLNNAAEESGVSPMVMEIDDSNHLSMQQQPQERRRHTEPGACAGCCGWQEEDEHRRQDIDTRIPSSDDAMALTAARVTNIVARSAIKIPSRDDETNTVRGIKIPSKSGKKSHKSSSTLPNDAVEYHIALQSGNSNKESAITESTPRDPPQPPSTSSVVKGTNVKSDDGNLFASWCGPRQLDLVADDTTSAYKGRGTAKAAVAPTAYRIYEEPLRFEKRDRSLFDPFSYEEEEEEAGQQQQDRDAKTEQQQLEHDTEYEEEEEGRTYHEEAQTTMAMMEMEDIPMDGRDDDDDDVNKYDDNKEDDFYEETGSDDGYQNEERNTLRRLRLPRNLPTVRNTLSRMSSLSRLRSSGRSQKSGRSRSRSRRRRRRSRSKANDDGTRHRRRHRSRSRGQSTERRSYHNSKRKHSQQNYIVSEEHFRSDRERRHYRKIPIT